MTRNAISIGIFILALHEQKGTAALERSTAKWNRRTDGIWKQRNMGIRKRTDGQLGNITCTDENHA